jgi:hypothetical protein
MPFVTYLIVTDFRSIALRKSFNLTSDGNKKAPIYNRGLSMTNNVIELLLGPRIRYHY